MAKVKVLSLGHIPHHNPETVKRFYEAFDVITTTPEERARPTFLKNLREKHWGDFQAIIRCFWYEGGEMGDFDEELIKLLPESLKVHTSCGAGYDHMNIPLYTERGIVYCNGATAPDVSVADLTLWHIISVFRQLTHAQFAAKSGSVEQWLKGRADVGSVHDPDGHTLGIVGMGNIGYVLAKKAQLGLSMKIQYYDIKRRSEEQEKAVGARYFETLEELLGNSDCVVVCVPFAGTTLFTAERFSQMKKGSYFINMGRGPLHDEEALVQALKSGHLAGAGLDVQEKEPEVHPGLIELSNVTLTPHIGGATIETTVGFERLTMENVEAFFATGKALTPVNVRS